MFVTAGPGQFGGGSVINNGGTATIGTGDNVTDTSDNGLVIIGAGSSSFSQSGNGYVTMSGGTLGNGANALTEMLGVDGGQWNLHPNRRHQRSVHADPSGTSG